MHTRWILTLLLMSLSGPALAQAMPAGWTMNGAVAAYDAGTGAVPGMSANEAVWLRPGDGASYSKYGLLTHTVSAEQYRGKRVLVWARLKSERVERLALWAGVDDAAAKSPLLSDRASLFGTNDWELVGALLDVPENASTLSYGVLLKGATGQGWFESIWIEEFNPSRYQVAKGKIALLQPVRRTARGNDWTPSAGFMEGGSAFSNPFPGTWSAERGWVAGYPGSR